MHGYCLMLQSLIKLPALPSNVAVDILAMPMPSPLIGGRMVYVDKSISLFV
jgi:hypothetical protein